MIKEKYINKISYILLSIALFLCFIIYFYNKFTPETLITPEYVNKIFNKDKVLEINIEISDENFKKLKENALQEEYVVANITINDTTINNVGIRAKGNSSLQQVSSSDSDRFSFKVNFSEYISDQNLYGLEKLVLNNMIGDTTYMKEYLSYDLIEFLGVNTPAYAFANIKINNNDWGLYLAIETLEEDFLERYYGKDYGNLYKPESNKIGDNKDKLKSPPNNKNDNKPIFQNNTYNNNFQPLNNSNTNNTFQPPNDINKKTSSMPNSPPNMINNKETALVYIDDNTSSYSKIFDSVVTKGLTEVDKNNFIKMIKSLNTGENIEKYINVDEVLRYFAANTFLVNLDSYAGSMKHNYYLYEENGIFEILPWDFNLSFGTFQINDASKVVNFPIDTPVTDSMENSPLISSLLNIEEYKNLYHSYLNDIVNNYVNNRYFENKINYLNELIYEYVKNDKTSFYTLDEYILGIENLLIFANDRAKSIYLQLNNIQPSTEYGTLETTLNLEALGHMPNDKNKEFNKNNNQNIKNNIENKIKSPNINLNNKINTLILLKILLYFLLIIISLIYVFLYKNKRFNI